MGNIKYLIFLALATRFQTFCISLGFSSQQHLRLDFTVHCTKTPNHIEDAMKNVMYIRTTCNPDSCAAKEKMVTADDSD